MAVRIVALLIPLAITLPQLQISRPTAPAAQQHAAPAQTAPAAEWSFQTRRGADAAMSRVELEAPLQEAVRTIASPARDTAVQAAANPGVRKAPAKRTAPKLARAASPVKVATTTAKARHAKRPPLHAGCEPFAHCAPVEVAKVTPVSRRSM